MDPQVRRRHTDTFVFVKAPLPVARTPQLRTRHSIQLPARISQKPVAPDTLPLISFDEFLKSSPSIAGSSIHQPSIHQPMSDPTTFIRVERDYSLGDGITKFSLEYPPELEGKVCPLQPDINLLVPMLKPSGQLIHFYIPCLLPVQITEEQLRHTVTTINAIMYNAERLSNNVFDNVMEILTIYLWPMFFSTHYQRAVKRLLRLIEDENKSVYNKQGLTIANPIKSAFLFLELRPTPPPPPTPST